MNETSFETVKSTVKGVCKWVLVKIMLFWLDGRGHSQNEAMPSFISYSKSSIYVEVFNGHFFIIYLRNWQKKQEEKKSQSRVPFLLDVAT